MSIHTELTMINKRDLNKMKQQIALLREALQATQWGFNHCRCPVCAGWNVGPHGETDYAHTKDCIVAKALRLPD